MKHFFALFMIFFSFVFGATAEEQPAFSFDGEWHSGSFLTNMYSFQTFVRRDGELWVCDNSSISCSVDDEGKLSLDITEGDQTTHVDAILSQLSENVCFVYWMEDNVPSAYYIEISNDNYASGTIVCYEVKFNEKVLFYDGSIYSNEKSLPKSESIGYLYQDGTMYFIEEDSYFSCEVIFASEDTIILPTGNIVSHANGLPVELINVFVRTSADK